jgi:glutamate-1-semialdehyde 2,1-aminomutase
MSRQNRIPTRDYTPLLAQLAEAYTLRAPRSASLNRKALKYLVDGGSHALRLVEPFPPRVVSAQGAWFTDEDGHNVLDFWQGHLANVLGHNPSIVTTTLARAFGEGFGLQTGLTDGLQVETAEILCQRTGAERVRFTTSGSLATMYAILLARAFTGRDLVMKVGGGWHGAQPWGLKGVGYQAGFQQVDTEGLPPVATDEVLVTRFNDPGGLQDHFERYGDRIACFILEPLIGAGGSIPATREYLQAARRLTHQYGALLILDEVITGFRFRAGDAGALYDVQPDLATFGKVIGGGMPIAAVAGRANVLAQVGRAAGGKVKFSGGTYSAHPASLLAARTLMNYLIDREDEIYPRLAHVGEMTRQTLKTAFIKEGIYARCTGHNDEVLADSSLFRVHFPYRDDVQIDCPDVAFDPSLCDVVLGRQVLDLALLLEDVHMIHGHGAVSIAHVEDDIDFLGQACRRVARRVKASWE